MIKLGNNDITLKVGSNDVSAAYLGSTLVYSGGTPPTPSFDGKWLATYTGGTTSSAECDASSAITSGEITLTDLESAQIGDCVTSITGTFDNCGSLTSVTISDSVTRIGDYAFRRCSSLTEVTIPSSVTSISGSAFQYCSSMTSVTIGSGVTSIGNWTFRNCSGLTEVTIPNSVTTIGNEAFRYCSSLRNATISSGVISIGDSAFRQCGSLTSVTVLATTPPTLGSNVFNSTASNLVIYVPSASVSAYQSAWSSLASRIQAIP